MRFNKKLFALLAIFCVIASAGIVCAEDTSDSSGDSSNAISASEDTGDGAQDGDNYDPGVPYHADGTDPAAGGNETGNETAAPTTGVSSNATGNHTGNLTANGTGNATNSTNATNATANHGLLSTGNPILILLVVVVIIGAYFVIKRK